MAYLASGSDWLQRASGLIGYGNKTWCGWFRQRSLPTGSNYNTYLGFLNDTPAAYTEWSAIFSNYPGTGVDYYGAQTGSGTDAQDCGSRTAGQWVHLTIQESGSNGIVYVNGDSFFVPVYGPDGISAIVTEVLGGDSYSIGDLDVLYVRQWSAVLTAAQVRLEMASQTVVRTSNLYSNAPLLTNANDISGNGRHWTEVGSVDYSSTDEPEWFSLTNRTLGTATVITPVSTSELILTPAIPAGIPWSVSDAMVLFWSYTPVVDQVVSFWMRPPGDPATDPFRVRIPISIDNATNFIVTQSSQARSLPQVLTARAGHTYYIQLRNGGTTGDAPYVGGFDLHFSILPAPDEAITRGDIIINNDASTAPLTVLDPTTGRVKKVMVAPDFGDPTTIPVNGEHGATLQNGKLMFGTDNDRLQMYDEELALLSDAALPSGSDLDCVTINQTTQKFWICTNDQFVHRYSADGALEASYNITVGMVTAGGSIIGVSPDETILYFVHYPNGTTGPTIKRWDLIGGALLSDLVGPIAGSTRPTDILVMPDGSVIFDRRAFPTVSGTGEIRRYSAAGALLNTYSLTEVDSIDHLTYAVETDSFWAWIYKLDATYPDDFSTSRFLKINLSDGAYLADFEQKMESGPGSFDPDIVIDYDNPERFGHAFSCPFWSSLKAAAVGSLEPSVIDHMWMKNSADWKTELSNPGSSTPGSAETQCGSAGVGAGAQGGGAVKCLLVDTGNRADGCTENMAQVAGLTAAYVAPSVAMVTGFLGTIESGGFGHTDHAQYYRITAIEDGVESNAVTIGPFSLSGANRRVRLVWNLHPTADKYRLYGSQQSSAFGQLHRYRYPTGGAGLIFDIPAHITTIVDDYASVTTQEQLTPDPHWDTMFRAQYYYYISAKIRTSTGLCETPMAGPVMVQKTAPSTTFEVDISWSAYTPPVAGQVLEGYVLRRQNQGYHWEIVWAAQWELSAATLTYHDDPVNDRSPVTLPGKPTTVAKYLVCGHVPKAVPQVYVLKPVSTTTVVDGEATSTLTEPQQVLQVEGTDYTRETVEVNGRRYHLLVFPTAQRGDNCQEYEVTANVDGVETNADGTGDLITDAVDAFLWLLLNLIFNTYDSSVQPEGGVVSPNVPSGGKYFNDVPYSPGLIDKDSFTTTKAKIHAWISGGYVAARVIDTQVFCEEMLSEFVSTFGFDFYWSGGQWHLDVLHPDEVDVESLPVLDATDSIFKESLTWWFDESFANVLPYKIGPLGGGNDGFLYTGEVYDTQSIADNGRMPAETMELLYTRDRATGLHVMDRLKAQVANPVLRGTFRLGVKGLKYPPSTAFLLTHPYGPGPSGFVEHVCRVTRSNPNFDDLKHSLEFQSIESVIRGA